MTSEEKKRLEEKRDYFEEWISRFKKAQDAVPYVQKNLKLTNWEIGALTDPLDEASEIPLTGLAPVLEEENNYWTSALPMIPDIDRSAIESASSMSTGGTAAIFDYVTRVGDLNTPGAITYAQKHTAAYYDLQASRQRPQLVRSRLEQLNNPQTIERFEQALITYSNAAAKLTSRRAAANDIRNLLNGVKGDLWALARGYPKENMTWEKMAERLAKGGPTGAECHELVRQGENRSSLLGRLADILKDREGCSITNLDYVWTQVLNHIYAVLGLIALPPNV